MYKASLRRAQGYATITEPGECTKECDTFTCGHCNRVVHVGSTIQAEDISVSLCKPCMRMICGACTALQRCTPFEEKLAQAEAAARFLRDAGIGG